MLEKQELLAAESRQQVAPQLLSKHCCLPSPCEAAAARSQFNFCPQETLSGPKVRKYHVVVVKPKCAESKPPVRVHKPPCLTAKATTPRQLPDTHAHTSYWTHPNAIIMGTGAAHRARKRFKRFKGLQMHFGSLASLRASTAPNQTSLVSTHEPSVGAGSGSRNAPKTDRHRECATSTGCS